jgi:Tfp pilus assembly protein PilV
MMKNSKGMSLIDLLVSILILAITSAAFLGILLTALNFIDSAKEQTIAVYDLRDMMESIRSTRTTPFSTMLTNYPNGIQDGPGARPYTTVVGNYTLRSEHITVTYPNTAAEPLEVRVTVTWQDKFGRSLSTAMSTFKSRL